MAAVVFLTILVLLWPVPTGAIDSCFVLFRVVNFATSLLLYETSKTFYADQQTVSTAQGLAATRTISAWWPVGREVFFLTAPFRER